MYSEASVISNTDRVSTIQKPTYLIETNKGKIILNLPQKGNNQTKEKWHEELDEILDNIDAIIQSIKDGIMINCSTPVYVCDDPHRNCICPKDLKKQKCANLDDFERSKEEVEAMLGKNSKKNA